MRRLRSHVLVGIAAALLMTMGVRAETVTELVERMPVAGVQTNTATFETLLAMGEEGLAELCAMVRPPATGGDGKARSLIGGVTFYAARPEAGEARTLVEQAWLSALAAAEDRNIKAFFIRRLQQCGTLASRDVLAGYLCDAALTEPAAQALLAIGAPKTADCFLDALEAGQGNITTLIQSLGVLAHGKALGLIRPYAESSDHDLQAVALDALASIGPVKRWIGWDNDTFDLLAISCESTNRFAKSQAFSRCLRYAEVAASHGARKLACAATQTILTMSREGGTPMVQAAALALLIDLDREAGLAEVTGTIHGDDRVLSVAGIRLLMQPEHGADALLVDIVSNGPAHVRAAAMDSLERGAPESVVEAVFAGVSDTNSMVRVSALSAAARLAGRQAMPVILQALDSSDPDVLTGVRDALLCLALPKDMVVLTRTMQGVAPAARTILLEVLGERHAVSQWDAVVAATGDVDADVRIAACSALGGVGTSSHLPLLLNMSFARDDTRERRVLDRAIVTVARSEPDAARRYPPLQDAFREGDADVRASLLTLVRAIGGGPGLDLVVAARKDPDAKVRDAALRNLAGWADDAAAEAMLTAVADTQDTDQKIRLLRGMLRVVSGSKRKPEAKLVLYREALVVAPRNKEKNMILAAMEDVRSRTALDLAAPLLNDPALQGAAARVVALSASPEKKYKGITDTELRPSLVKAAALLEDEKLKRAVDALIATMPPPAVLDPGFESIFNGSDLSGWIGDTTGYVVDDGQIICRPGGNLYTAQEYSNFIFRFEFKLTTGANNGLGVRTPPKGNAAYAGMELQILDNTAPKYADLKPWQYHGSIYGLIPAKRGHLRPVGEWNVQEVTAIGSKIKVDLNGVTIVDADLSSLAESEPGRHPLSKHPGILNTSGHLAFLGHGAVVSFRNLRIKDLGATTPPPVAPPDGFVALFNGKDLQGWKGLPSRPNDNPIKRAALSPEALAAAQKEADDDMRAHWQVADGALVFDGKGRSICTAKDYGDFEMLVDWKIKARGDSGIYLRGAPQVQIWDPTQHKKGSGGLYNNKKNPRHPTVIADNPIEEWNTFRIRMVGDKVTVHLNGQLVTDNVVMENYWDRKQPIFPAGQIELQNHGNTLWFRNIFIREL